MPQISLQIRRDTEARWLGTGTILRPGEQSYSTDTNVIKIGDGVNVWSALPPIAGGGGSSTSPLMTDNFMMAGGSSTAPQTSLAYSYDGLTWVSSPTNIFDSGQCIGLAWNGSIWLAVGTNNGTDGIIASSPDGIRWTVDLSGSSTPFTAKTITTVAWNGSLWVAGGGGASGSAIATSADGKTWIAQTSPFTDNVIRVAANGNMFVAGGTTADSNVIAYSYDGVIWIKAPVSSIFNVAGGFDAAVWSIAWNGQVWVAGGNDKLNKIVIVTSSDGINWFSQTIPGSSSGFIISIAWNGSLWMACGLNSTSNKGIVLTSPDGNTWTNITANLGGTNPFLAIYTVTWNGARWFLGGFDNSTSAVFLTSADTITWTSKNTYIGNNIITTASRRVLPYVGLSVVGSAGPLLSLSYYLANNTGANTGTNAISVIGFDTPDPTNSVTGGALQMNYDKTTGLLTNTSSKTISVLVSGQVTTDNRLFDLTRIQPCLYVTKNADNIVSSSVINFNGSSFSTIVVLAPSETISIRYSQTTPHDSLTDVSGVRFLGGQFSTRITFTQMEFLQGPSSAGGGGGGGAGSTGPTGIPGALSGVVSSSLIPNTPNAYDLGSTGFPFRSLHVTGSTIYLGNASIKETGGNIQLVSADGSISAAGSTGPTGPAGGGSSTSPLMTDNFMVLAGNVTILPGTSIAYSYDGLTWATSSTNLFSSTGVCNQVAWNGSIWLAVGADGVNGLIASSPDGITWRADLSGGSTPFSLGRVYFVAWNGSLWVACGSGSGGGGRIATSPDGKTWAAQTSPFSQNVYAVAANGNMFVVAGKTSDNNQIAYSYDGITWQKPNTSSIFGGGTSNARSVAWNGQLWVVGGRIEAGNILIATSPDGKTWTPRNTSIGGLTVGLTQSVAWNGSLWMAVGTDNTDNLNPKGFVITSPDGIAWTNITAKLGGTNPFSAIKTVSWNGARWFIGGQITPPDTYSSFTSVDTNTWVRVITGMEYTTYSFASRRVLPYVGLTVDGSAGSTGPTGPAGGGGGSSTSPLMTDNFMVAGGDVTTNPGSSIVYSYDGLTWVTSSTNIFNTGKCKQVAWNGSIWLAVGNDGTDGIIASSPDGIRWTVELSGSGTPFSGTSRSVNAVAWNGYLWVACGSGGGGGGQGRIATSADGKTWIQRTSPFANNCYAVAANGNMFVAVGYTNDYKNIAYSYDGIIWEKPNTTSIFGGLSARAYSVAWNGQLWVMGGIANDSAGIIATSPDGINWQPQTIPGSLSAAIRVYSVAWNGSLWMAGGSSNDGGQGFILTSPDGTTWEDITNRLGGTNPFQEVQNVSWNGARWFIGGLPTNYPGTSLTSVDTITWAPVTTDIGSTTYCSASRRVLPYVGLTVDGSAGSTGPTGPAGGGGGSSTYPLMTDNFMVAGGLSNGIPADKTLAYSYDGLTWQISPSATNLSDYTFYGVAWNGSKWLALGNDITNGVIASSPDGIRWRADLSGSGTPFSDGYVKAAAWNGSLWVAVGTTSSGSAITTSPDGKTWTAQTSPFDTTCNAVASNGNMFVAGGQSNTSNNISYSYNGTTWFTPTTSNIFGGALGSVESVAWNGQLWVVGGKVDAGDILIATSPDGKTWTRRTTTSGGLTLGTTASVAWNGSLWMAVGVNTSSSPVGFVITSPNGLTWTNITANLGGTNPFLAIKTVSWNGARWFIGGEIMQPDIYSSFTSVDTITWVPVTTGLTSTVYSSASRRVLPYVGLTVDGSAGSTGPTGPAGGSSISILPAGSSALTVNNVGTTYLLIMSGTTHNFTTNTLPSGNVSLIWFVKNCTPADIEIEENSQPILGPTSTLFALTSTNNSSLQYLYWNGTDLAML